MVTMSHGGDDAPRAVTVYWEILPGGHSSYLFMIGQSPRVQGHGHRERIKAEVLMKHIDRLFGTCPMAKH